LHPWKKKRMNLEKNKNDTILLHEERGKRGMLLTGNSDQENASSVSSRNQRTSSVT